MHVSLVILAGTLVLTSGIAAGDDVQVDRAKVNSFFARDTLERIPALKPYASIVLADGAVPAGGHIAVVKEFERWMRLVLQSQFQVSDEFVKSNIILLPAKRSGTTADLAFLSFAVGQSTIRVVQSGGVHARIWIFVHAPDGKPLASADKAIARIKDFLGAYIDRKFRDLYPTFTFRTDGGIYVGEHKALIVAEGPKAIGACFLSDSDTCLSIDKDFPDRAVPMQEPQPDQWFEWENGSPPETDSESTVPEPPQGKSPSPTPLPADDGTGPGPGGSSKQTGDAGPGPGAPGPTVRRARRSTARTRESRVDAG